MIILTHNLGRVLLLEASVAEVHATLERAVERDDRARHPVRDDHVVVGVGRAGARPSLVGRLEGSRSRRTAGDDVGRERKRRADEEASRLADDADPVGRGEVALERDIEDTSHLDKVLLLKAASDIEEREAVADLTTHVKDGASARNSVVKHLGVLATRADVERDADDVEAERPGERQQRPARVERSSKLQAEATERLGIVGQNAENELGRRV